MKNGELKSLRELSFTEQAHLIGGDDKDKCVCTTSTCYCEELETNSKSQSARDTKAKSARQAMW